MNLYLASSDNCINKIDRFGLLPIWPQSSGKKVPMVVLRWNCTVYLARECVCSGDSTKPCGHLYTTGTAVEPLFTTDAFQKNPEAFLIEEARRIATAAAANSRCEKELECDCEEELCVPHPSKMKFFQVISRECHRNTTVMADPFGIV